MSDVTTIAASKVFDGLLALIRAKPWLIEVSSSTSQCDERETIHFLHSLQQGGVADWGDTPAHIRSSVTGVLVDFMTELRRPSSVFENESWEVSAKALPWQQAIEVLVQEIKLSDPR